MNNRQRRRYERGARVRDLAETVKQSFPEGTRGAQSILRINQLVERAAVLDASLSTNTRTARDGTTGKSEAREQLRALLKQLSRTARATGDPSLAERFRLNHHNNSAQALVSTARSFLSEAGPARTIFVEYGMADDFLDTLGARINTFESQATRQNEGTAARAADSAGLAATLDELDDEIDRFDIIFRNKLDQDPARLAAWDSARRLERDPHRRHDDKDAPPDAPLPDAA